MNKLKTILILYFLINSTVHAFGQYYDDSIDEIINSKNDTLFKNIDDYNFYALKYKESIFDLRKIEKQVDSVRNIIRSSSLVMEAQGITIEIINLAINDKDDDVSLKVKELDPLLISSINKLVPLEFIYELDRNYYFQFLTIEKTKLWVTKISKFILNKSIDYFNADKIKVPDTVFLSEVKTYKFRKHDVIADIGAGSGYFERVLSMYCDYLTVYVNEINSSSLSQLRTKLKFLEFCDQKNIAYNSILGNESSSLLPSNSFDKVIIRNTYHHFSNPNKMIEDCKRILKENGKLYIIDILIDETVKEPECKFHLTRKDFLKVIYENGFNLINETMLEYDNFKCFEFRFML